MVAKTYYLQMLTQKLDTRRNRREVYTLCTILDHLCLGEYEPLGSNMDALIFQSSLHSTFFLPNSLVLQFAFSQSSFARRVVILLVMILLWGCYPCGSFGGCCDFVVLDWTPSGIAFLAVKGQLVKSVPNFAA